MCFYITLLHNAQVPLISFSCTFLPLRSDRVPLHCIALQGSKSTQEIPLHLYITLFLVTFYTIHQQKEKLSNSFSLAIHYRSVWCAYGIMAYGFYPGIENSVTCSLVHASLHQISFYYGSLSLKTLARMVQLKPVSDKQKLSCFPFIVGYQTICYVSLLRMITLINGDKTPD